jgi:hypothetical protein
MAAKIKLFPILLAALLGIAAAIVLSQFQLNIWLEPSSSNDGPVTIEPAPNPPKLATTPDPASQTPLPDGLRVSNQSSSAVRLVLQSQRDRTATAAAPPIHWDFAPMEGSKSGLLLSLPSGNVQLQPGDVLVAFAIDGSKRYWGPYIVGQSTSPVRKGQPPIWELTLNP